MVFWIRDCKISLESICINSTVPTESGSFHLYKGSLYKKSCSVVMIKLQAYKSDQT